MWFMYRRVLTKMRTAVAVAELKRIQQMPLMQFPYHIVRYGKCITSRAAAGRRDVYQDWNGKKSRGVGLLNWSPK